MTRVTRTVFSGWFRADVQSVVSWPGSMHVNCRLWSLNIFANTHQALSFPFRTSFYFSLIADVRFDAKRHLDFTTCQATASPLLNAFDEALPSFHFLNHYDSACQSRSVLFDQWNILLNSRPLTWLLLTIARCSDPSILLFKQHNVSSS